MEILEDIILCDFITNGTTADFQTPDMKAEGANGIEILVDTATAGTGTLTLRIFGKEPFEGNYSQMNVDVLVQGTGNRSQYYLYPGVARQPPGEAGVTTGANVRQVVSLALPGTFAIAFVKGGDVSNWKYGAVMRRLA
jgi:hypothetical protein